MRQRTAIIGAAGVKPAGHRRATAPVAGAAAAAPVVNTRLVAAVQARAGARCHQSANLLSTYYLCADVYRMRMGRGDASSSAEAWRTLKQAEQRLREFLTGSVERTCHASATCAWSVSAWNDGSHAGAGLAAMAG